MKKRTNRGMSEIGACRNGEAKVSWGLSQGHLVLRDKIHLQDSEHG